MEKNTILAIVLSTIVLIGSLAIQSALIARQQEANQTEQTGQIEAPPVSAPVQVAEDSAPQTAPQTAQMPIAAEEQLTDAGIEDAGPQAVEYITINTNTITAVLTNAGGDMVSWKLKEHKDNEEFVDMIFSGEKDAHAFSIAFGGADPVSNLFYVNRISEHTVEFYRDVAVSYGGVANSFRLVKRYDFKPNDYMFELTVTLEGAQGTQGFDFGGSAYALNFGPQIGPKFDKLDARYDYRQYHTYVNGKQRTAKLNEDIDTRPSWASISGKYFVFIAIPHVAQYTVKFTQTPEPGVPSTSRLNISRAAVNQRTVTDSYKFYLGPKTSDALNIYHTGRNDFGFKDSTLVDAASSGFWGPLVKVLKWLLLLCYKVFPNYGVAILLLTLLIKLVFFPLTKKGSEATSRMQELGPKIKELQEKYKDNPQKLNAEMAAFYQKEGYNPLSGCLPMLIQFPIIIGMYQLFNTHFDLRGASFIAGWIPDLSVPESIFTFPDGFRVPLLGWEAIRALPFIYVGSQLLYGKFTQTPGQQSGAQMKIMMYAMPIVFFFILYNVPSGLLIYWIFSNILTLVQQIIINKYIQKKKEMAQSQVIHAEEPKAKIAPKKHKKKR